MSNEIQKHEELKQCAIHAYGKNKNLPVNYKLTNTFINNHNGFSASILKKDNEIIISYCGSYPVSGYTRSDGKEVKSYIRTCYKHSSTLRSYVGKSYSEMSDSEKDEFLNDYI